MTSSTSFHLLYAGGSAWLAGKLPAGIPTCLRYGNHVVNRPFITDARVHAKEEYL
jgi:hypothetical protein